MRTVSLKLPNGSTLEMKAPDGLYVPRVLAESGLGRYEPDTIAAALAMTSLREGVFVDVGANVGVFSLAVAAVLERPCLAFEPLPEASEVLEATAKRYRLPIVVSRIALADRSGEAEFYVSNKTDSSSGLNQRFRPVKSSFKVALGRLDDVINGATALLKIDTETTEPAVLAGAERLVREERPPMIVEVLKDRTEDAIQAYFSERRYVAHHITDAERWPVADRVVGDASYRHNNWFFAPEPLAEGFWGELQRWRAALAKTA